MKYLISFLILFINSNHYCYSQYVDTLSIDISAKFPGCENLVDSIDIPLPYFPAEYSDGVPAFTKYIDSTRSPNCKGKAYVSFYIDLDGSVRCVKITGDINELCKSDLKTAFERIPNFQPATKRDKIPVWSKSVIPINFK